jgi:flagellar basal-body rod protein FlgB
MSETIKQLQNLASFLVIKNKVISKNIANIGTENYMREDVVFKDMLEETSKGQLRATNGKHFGPGNSISGDGQNYRIIYDSEKDPFSGINNVDIDKEMTELAETTLMYKFTARKISDYFKSIQYVIRGR